MFLLTSNNLWRKINQIIKVCVFNINLISFKYKEMADIIKVKPKKKYEWNQDKKYLYVQVPLPAHTSLKKV